MKAERIYMSAGTNRFFAQMDDGSYKWVHPDFSGVEENGPLPDWVRRGLTAHSVSWAGPSIQPPLGEGVFLNTLNKNL